MFHARDGAIFSKNSTFVFFDGASPITEKGIQLRSPSPIMAPGLLLENCDEEYFLNKCAINAREMLLKIEKNSLSCQTD